MTIERLIMKVKGEATIGAASFKSRIDILSSPVALFTGKLLIKRKISLQIRPLYISQIPKLLSDKSQSPFVYWLCLLGRNLGSQYNKFFFSVGSLSPRNLIFLKLIDIIKQGIWASVLVTIFLQGTKRPILPWFGFSAPSNLNQSRLWV